MNWDSQMNYSFWKVTMAICCNAPTWDCLDLFLDASMGTQNLE